MGRIDDALRRSNLDVARDARVPAPTPDPSPWQFEPHEGGNGHQPSAGAAHVAPEHAAEPKVADTRVEPWEEFDPAAVERLVVWPEAPALLVEQFRGLAATLHQAQAEHGVKSLIVTSATPGDGKSHVAVNLALTLSESYHRRVLLVDADLRRPTLHSLFRTRNTRGLSAVLRAHVDAAQAVVAITDSLSLLPAGRPEANPLGGLSSDRMKQVVADASARFDWVIVDSPPVGVLADARLVSETVDAAIVVVRAGATRFPDLKAAADTLGHERILGLVLNAVDPLEIRGEGYYRRYYRQEADKG